MYQRRVCSEITGLTASFWHVALLPFTIFRFLLALGMKRVVKELLSIPLIQCLLSPRFGDNPFSRIGRILFVSQRIYSSLGGSLAGAAFLTVYLNVSLVRFDGSYYVTIGGEKTVYAQEQSSLVITMPEVTPIAVSTQESMPTPEVLIKELTAPVGKVVEGTVQARYAQQYSGALNADAVGAAAQVDLAGSFMTPLRNPPRLLITTYYRPGHPGMDLSTDMGTPLYAVADGLVSATGSSIWAYGSMVKIDHGGGWESMYAHMSRIDVKTGQSVNQGTVIGAVGSTGNSTGPHLHLELHKDGRPVNPRGLVAGL